MTLHQKSLLTVVIILATGLFIWPAGILMLWFFLLINGDIPTIATDKKRPSNR